MNTSEEEGLPFKTTSEDSGNVGKEGHDSDATWTKFYRKYYPPVAWFIEANYPKHKDEAQDVFQRVAARIAQSPEITNHDFKDKFRTVVIKLCRRELDRMHPKNRQEADRKFRAQPFHIL